MATEHGDAFWLHAEQTISIEELATASGFSVAEIAELVEYGALRPAGEMVFSAHYVGWVRKAARLRQDLELDLPALALIVSFLERIDALESELRKLSAQLPR
jgi:chaperone modulatory protein CbpM